MGEIERDSEDTLGQFITKDAKHLSPSTSPATIYRVPKELREGNIERHFTPTTISIGPLHAKQKDLMESNEVKEAYFASYISRLPANKASDKELFRDLKRLVAVSGECYGDAISMKSEEFLKMMLLDGCFIVELLLRHDWRRMNRENLIMGRGGSIPLHKLLQDLLKLENQIPFSVVHSLYKLVPDVKANLDGGQSLVESALSFFQIAMPTEETLHCHELVFSIKHLLHLAMIALFSRPPTHVLSPDDGMHQTSIVEINASQKIPTPNVRVDMSQTIPTPTPRRESSQNSKIKARSASELDKYGIKFRKRQSNHLTDINFNNGVLEIPSLVFQDSTTSLFWNLLMLELCSDDDTRLFTSYVIFMDGLISNSIDVELLLRSGVLQTRVNDVRELVSLFNHLSTNVITIQKDFDFNHQLQQVNRYCDSGIHPLRAYLVRNYYDVRWNVINSVLLFILTCAQTLFAVLSYKPKNK
ncbi:hypothetical protein RJ639_039043 [Escallonia herrerae]|uniref:Uncharacterized protein n=1 Tax=Escallonia herrerae TaxID=1293975 RepID=A0AA88WIG8_9ASTE|nr:hypothetical protein RJ639_039043 [Escallonia herrerae]